MAENKKLQPSCHLMSNTEIDSLLKAVEVNASEQILNDAETVPNNPPSQWVGEIDPPRAFNEKVRETASSLFAEIPEEWISQADSCISQLLQAAMLKTPNSPELVHMATMEIVNGICEVLLEEIQTMRLGSNG